MKAMGQLMMIRERQNVPDSTHRHHERSWFGNEVKLLVRAKGQLAMIRERWNVQD